MFGHSAARAKLEKQVNLQLTTRLEEIDSNPSAESDNDRRERATELENAREIVPRQKRQLIQNELISGVNNGVAVAIVTSLAVFAWRWLPGDTMTAVMGLALVMRMAMIVNMAAAAVSNAIIPLLLQACGRDPAQLAVIFLTTLTEIVGFAAFLGFASLLMPVIASTS